LRVIRRKLTVLTVNSTGADNRDMVTTHWVLMVEIWVELGQKVRTVIQLLDVSREPSSYSDNIQRQKQQSHSSINYS